MKLDKKIGLFSDIHLGLGQGSDQWHNISLNFAKWASEVFKNKGIEQILIPGDIFHNRSEIGVNTISVAKQFFDYFKDFKLFISTGNHCCYFKNNSTINSISILDGWSNIKIFDKTPAILSYKDKKISMIPWGIEYDQIPESDICIGHFEISSFYMNSYKVCEHGMESKQLFKKAPLIVSGHFHKKDDRKYDKGRIVYLGSPYQHNFGDTGDSRGIYILNLDNNEFEFIENNTSPKHIKLSLKDLDKKTNSIDKIVKNNIVSLVVDAEIDQEKLAVYIANLQKISPISFRTDYLDNSTDINKIDDSEEFNSGNLLKDIEDFVNNLTIENKKEVIEYLTESYNLLSK